MSNKYEDFGDDWCPLTGELPYEESLQQKDERIMDCIEIIENAREIWDSNSQGKYPEWKLNSATAIWKLLRNSPDTTTNLFTSATEHITGWIRASSKPKIDNQVAGYHIYAILAMFKACLCISLLFDKAKNEHGVATLIDAAKNKLWEAQELQHAIEKKEEMLTKYNWSIDNQKKTVSSNNKLITKISGINWELFRRLFEKSGKYVKTETLEKCWVNKPNYQHFLVDAIGEVRKCLKAGLNKQNIEIIGGIIEKKTKDKSKRIISYKLQP